MKTITYSRVGSLEIKLDLYTPHSAIGKLPAVIFYHGGGIVAGSRKDLFFPEWLKDGALKRGIIFISADHRLILPSTGFDIIDDVKALFAFLASPKFSADHLPSGVVLDPTHIGVSGASGGGYESLLAGIYASPKPKAVLPLFGMGGAFLTDHWLKIKDTRMPTPGADAVTHESALKVIADLTEPATESAILLYPDHTVMDEKRRFALFIDWYKEGTYLDYLLGRPGLSASLRDLPVSERLAAVPEELRAALPETLLDSTFPPTYLLHGDLDGVVSPGESEATYRRLKELGVRVELDVVKDALHGLSDVKMAPALSDAAEEAQERALVFLAGELL